MRNEVGSFWGWRRSTGLVFVALLMFVVAATLGCAREATDEPAAFEPMDVVVVDPTVTPTMVVVATAAVEAGREDGRGIIYHHFLSFLMPDPVVDRASNGFLFGEVFSGLVRFRDGLEGEIEPDLASTYSISDDGLRYRFELRDGLRFSDGRPLTADDVKWSWERALIPDTNARRAGEVLGEIVGAEELMAGETNELAGVTVVDDSTLEVELKRRRANFLMFLADPMASVLSHENVANWGTVNWSDFARGIVYEVERSVEFDELPVGTGPFRIVELHYERGAILEPNPNYWDLVPKLDALVYRTAVGPGYEWAGLLEYDVYASDPVFMAEVREGNPGTIDGVSLGIFEPADLATAPEVSFLALNTAVAPFDDLEFRRALSLSSDRSRSIEVFMAEVPEDSASGLLPPKFPGHAMMQEWEGPDRDLATSAMERSRYGEEGYRDALMWVSDGSMPYPFLFDDLSQYWSEWLGLEFEDAGTEYIPLDRFESEYRRGVLQMRYVYVKPRYPDPHAILGMIPGLFGPNAESNETRELTAMLAEAEVESDRAARIEKYQAIERHILDRALVIPIFWDDGTVYELFKPYVHGYRRPAYHGSRYKDVTIDTTHRDYPADRLGE